MEYKINKVITSDISKPTFEKINDNEVDFIMPEIIGFKIYKNNTLSIKTSYNKFRINFKDPKNLTYELIDSNIKIKEKRRIYQKKFKKICKNCCFRHPFAKMENDCIVRQKISEIYENIKDFKERIKKEQAIYKEYEKHTCEFYKTQFLETPFEVNNIIINDKNIKPDLKLVKVRPCNEQYKNKTFLGILINYWYPCDENISLNNNKELKVNLGMSNPLIYIPETNTIARGYNSYWGEIKNPNFSPITDDTINNLWYVKLADAMFNKKDS
jgi:hypothetical protein